MDSDWLNWVFAIGLPALVRFGGKAVSSRKAPNVMDDEKLALRRQVQELRAELDAMKMRLAEIQGKSQSDQSQTGGQIKEGE